MNPTIISSGPSPELPQVANGRSRSGGAKKWIVIGGILMIVALGLGLAAIMIMPKGNDDTASKSISFNRLINYIINGADSVENVNTEYDAMNNYYFLSGWSNTEQKQEIYDKTKALMGDFVNEYENGENEVMNNLVKYTKDQIDFMSVMDFQEKITGAKIIETSIKNENAKQSLKNFYKLSELSDNIYATEFTEAYGEWVDALISEINLYQENGCVINENLDDACMMVKDNEEMNTKLAEITEAIKEKYDTVALYYNMASGFVKNVFNINDLLNGKSLMGDENE